MIRRRKSLPITENACWQELAGVATSDNIQIGDEIRFGSLSKSDPLFF